MIEQARAFTSGARTPNGQTTDTRVIFLTTQERARVFTTTPTATDMQANFLTTTHTAGAFSTGPTGIGTKETS